MPSKVCEFRKMVKIVKDSTLKKFSHNQGQNWFHLVFTPKCRYPVFQWKVIKDLCETAILEVCSKHNIDLFAYEVMEDHVHLFVTCPPCYSINKLMRILKGGTSYYIRSNYKSLRKYDHLWSRGATYRSVSNVTADTVHFYITNNNIWGKK